MLSPIIEVAISLAFIYLLFSLVVSWINEFITSRLATRGKYLREQLSEALDDQFNKNWAELLYVHPTVDLLAKREQRPPAYIPGNLFATGLIDLIINEAKIVTYHQYVNKNIVLDEKLPYQKPINNFHAGLQNLKKSDIKILLQNFLDNSDGDYDKLKHNIVVWYDDYMDRVSGWYKKKIRGRLFLISLLVAIAFNLNTIKIVTSLWKNASLRQTLVKASEDYIAHVESTHTPTNDSSQSINSVQQLTSRIDSVYSSLRVLNLPIGYDGDMCSFSANEDGFFAVIRCAFKQWLANPNLSSIIGWLISAGALSYGAPFWFDIMKKFVNVRSAGIKPEKVSSEDIKH